MIDVYWAAAQTFSGMENLVRLGIEDAGGAAFLPSYVLTRMYRGRRVDMRRALISGYVFFQTSRADWGFVGAIKGVCGVLLDGGKDPARVHPLEMHRLMIENASRMHDVSINPVRQRQRRRRPRRSKAIRAITHR